MLYIHLESRYLYTYQKLKFVHITTQYLHELNRYVCIRLHMQIDLRISGFCNVAKHPEPTPRFFPPLGPLQDAEKSTLRNVVAE